MDDKWNNNDTRHPIWGYTDAFNTFANVDKLKDYLFYHKQYSVQSFEYSFDGSLPSFPSIGDIIQIDGNLDGKGDHSMFCVGYQKDRNGMSKLSIAQHSPNTLKPFEGLLAEYKAKYDTIKIYYIRMTDTYGLKVRAFTVLEISRFSFGSWDFSFLSSTIRVCSALTVCD